MRQVSGVCAHFVKRKHWLKIEFKAEYNWTWRLDQFTLLGDCLKRFFEGFVSIYFTIIILHVIINKRIQEDSWG